MNYLSYQVEQAAFNTNTPLRRAFRKHLMLVAKALHDIEWVDSCDYGEGADEKTMQACLTSTAILEQVLEDAKKARNELDASISQLEKKEKV